KTANAYRLRRARLSQKVIGNRLYREALDAGRRGNQGAIDMVLRMAADLLAIALLAAVHRQTVDVESDAINAFRPQIVERLDEDFDIVPVDHHAVVIVRLDDARLWRQVRRDGQAIRHVHQGRIV